MKFAIQMLFVIVLGIPAWLIVSILDAIMLVIMTLNKGVRIAYIAITSVVCGQGYHSEVNTYTDAAVNYAYKTWTNKMYPSEIEL